jgi:hypothetical protein
MIGFPPARTTQHLPLLLLWHIFSKIVIMSLLLSAATTDDNRLLLELISSPNSHATNFCRHHAGALLGHAGILGSDNGKKKEDGGIAHRASDALGIMSHLRASSSSHDNNKAAHSLMNGSLAQTVQAMVPHDTANPMVPRLDRCSSLLFFLNAAAVTQALVTRHGFLMISSAMDQPTLSQGGGVLGFSMANRPFGHDPCFMSRLVPSCFSPPVPASRREPVALFIECDKDSLSEHQCLIHKSIDLAPSRTIRSQDLLAFPPPFESMVSLFSFHQTQPTLCHACCH